MIAQPNADRCGPGAWVFSLCIASACASATVPPPVTPAAVTLSPDPSGPLDPSEARAIQAAKNHPIATSYERPHALPVAPARPPEPAPALNARAAPQDQVIIVGQEQAIADGSITSYGGPNPPSDTYPPADSVASAATTTVSTVHDQGYVWTDGAWVAAPTVGIGVGVYGPDVWIGYSPWAWGYAPYYRPYWPVAAPYYGHHHHHHQHYSHPHHAQPLPHRPPPARYTPPASHARDHESFGSHGNGSHYGRAANQRNQAPYGRRDVYTSAARPIARDATIRSAPAARRAGVYTASPARSWSSASRRSAAPPAASGRSSRRPSGYSAPPAASFNRSSSSSWGGSFGGERRSVQMNRGRR